MSARRRRPDRDGLHLALLVLVLRLGADYLEWSTSISQWAYEMKQRARRGGGLAAAVYIASGSSLAATVVTALLVLLIERAPMLVLVGRAFDWFDAATEIPA